MDWNTQLLAMAAFVLPLASVPAASQDTVERLAPTAGWTLNYDDDSCALVRTFGDESAPTLLELRQYAPGASLTVTVASQQQMTLEVAPQVHFLPQQTPSGLSGTHAIDLGGGYQGFRANLSLGAPVNEQGYLLAVDPERDAHEAMLQTLHVGSVFEQDFELETGAMVGPMAALRDCMADLIGLWGLDPERHRGQTTLPQFAEGVEEFGEYLSRMDASLRRDIGGDIQYLLMISDTDGQVQDCRPLLPNGSAEFAQFYCEGLRASVRFEPARDANGDPMPSLLTQRIWIPPNQRRRPMAIRPEDYSRTFDVGLSRQDGP